VQLSRGNQTTAELARILETSWPAAARLEDHHHWPSLRQLEKTANAMGKRLVLSFV
jgi:antitoxin HicB